MDEELSLTQWSQVSRTLDFIMAQNSTFTDKAIKEEPDMYSIKEKPPKTQRKPKKPKEQPAEQSRMF
jgi:hypothetical protein